MNKVLITGAAGLFGSNFSRYLLDKHYKVVGVDNLSGGNIEFVPIGSPDFEFIKADVGDKKVLKRIESGEFSHVYHFAAMAAAGLSPFCRVKNYDDNVVQPAKLINACVNGNVTKLIFTSSMEVYGEAKPPFTEEDIKTAIPLTPYGIAKRAIELDLESAYQYHGLDYAIIRPHNVHGKYQNIWDRYRNVIGIFIRQTFAGEPLTIYGDGTQLRAFSDIRYYMEPLEQLMNTHSRKYSGGPPAWNIGAEKPTSILELAKSVSKTAKDLDIPPTEIVFLEERNEVKNAWCDHTKAKEQLNFKDETEIDILVRDMMVWAFEQTVRPVKSIDYEIKKGLYDYWK